MSSPDGGLVGAVATAAGAASKLGIDVSAQAASIGSFLKGGYVIAVAGLAGTGRSRVGAALSGAVADIEVLELDLNAMPRLPLWDLLVVVTPADRALSHSEEALVRTSRSNHRPVVVAVTRADMLGDPAIRAETEAEIEQFRLAPKLGPLGVRWFFVGEPDTLDRLAGHVAQVLDDDPGTAHQRPAREALNDVLDGVTGQLGERLARREAELGMLRAVETQLPLIMAHTQEEVGRAPLAVRNTLRAAEERLFRAGVALADAAVAWIARDGLGAWSDVEQPLWDGWSAFLGGAGGALDAERARFQSEVLRLHDKIAASAGRLGLPPPAAPPLLETWATPAVEDVRRSLAAIDLSPIVAALRARCAAAVQQDAASRDAGAQDGDEQRGAKEAGAFQRISERLGINLQQLLGGSPTTRLVLRIYADLDAIVGHRFASLVEAASGAAQAGARADATAGVEAMKRQLQTLRSALEDRHAWGEAYGQLLELRAWTAGPERDRGL